MDQVGVYPAHCTNKAQIACCSREVAKRRGEINDYIVAHTWKWRAVAKDRARKCTQPFGLLVPLIGLGWKTRRKAERAEGGTRSYESVSIKHEKRRVFLDARAGKVLQ